MRIKEFQEQIESLYFEKDAKRGVEKTFIWFIEEVGELARCLLHGNDKNHLKAEFADVFAWLTTLASLTDVDLEEAIRKYGQGCPKCNNSPCKCKERGD